MNSDEIDDLDGIVPDPSDEDFDLEDLMDFPEGEPGEDDAEVDDDYDPYAEHDDGYDPDESGDDDEIGYGDDDDAEGDAEDAED